MTKFRETGIGLRLREDLSGATEYLLGISNEVVADNFDYRDSSDFLYILLCAEKRLADVGDDRASLVGMKVEDLSAQLRARNPLTHDYELPF